MLDRCYNKDNYSNNIYDDCIVHSDWLNFQNFCNWCENNYIDGFVIDKDIISPDSREYGPNTCCFVPNIINQMFKRVLSKASDLPRGVSLEHISKNSWKYRAQITKYNDSKSFNKITVNLGRYDNPDKAHEAYINAKQEYLQELIEKYSNELKPNVLEILKSINFKERYLKYKC